MFFLNEVANQNPRDLEAPWVVRERVLQIDAFRACGGRCCTSLRNKNILLTRTWNVNIWLLYGVVFPIGSVLCVACKYRASLRCCFSYRLGAMPAPSRPHRTDWRIGKTARTEPIGKTAPYGSPIFTCHVRINNMLLFLNEVEQRPPYARNASICKTRSRTTPWASRSRGF